MSIALIGGDSNGVRSGAAQMQAAAETLQQAWQALNNLSQVGDFKSAAVDAVRTSADNLAVSVHDAYVRYSGAAEALAEYAPQLDAAQQLAARAVHAASGVDVGAHARSVDTLEVELVNPLLSTSERNELHQRLVQAKGELEEQQAALRTAEADYDAAMNILNAAAERAAGGIKDAVEASHLNDSLLDKLKNFMQDYIAPFLQAVKDVMDWVSTALSVMSIIVALVPGLEEFAPLLSALSMIASGLALAATLYLYMMGDATLGTLMSEAVSTGLALIPGGKAGKLIGKALKGADEAAPVVEDGVKVADDGATSFEKMGIDDGAQYIRETWSAADHGAVRWGKGTVELLKDFVPTTIGWLAGRLVDLTVPESLPAIDRDLGLKHHITVTFPTQNIADQPLAGSVGVTYAPTLVGLA